MIEWKNTRLNRFIIEWKNTRLNRFIRRTDDILYEITNSFISFLKYLYDHNKLNIANQLKATMFLGVLLVMIGTIILFLWSDFVINDSNKINNIPMLLVGILCGFWGCINVIRGDKIFKDELNNRAEEIRRNKELALRNEINPRNTYNYMVCSICGSHRSCNHTTAPRRAIVLSRDEPILAGTYYVGPPDPFYGIGPVRQSFNNVYVQQARAIRELQLAQMQLPQPIALSLQKNREVDPQNPVSIEYSKPNTEEKPFIPVKVINSILSLEI
jgi:hypothetical protein